MKHSRTEYNGVDPAHFYTSPGLAWQACLKKTGIKLGLLTDPDMLLMFECGIRGGITQAVHRYAKANNKYMGEQHNPEEVSRFLQYLDTNNLHGGAIFPTTSSWGVEVGNYVIHVRALNQALKHGLILEKIHQLIEFNQSTWLKPYIDMNTNLRAKAENEFGKEFFKLINNSVFSKTMENVRKHKDIKLITNAKNYLKAIMKPNLKSGIPFSENLMGCEMGKVKVVVNKPVYLGQAILDLSKIVMYEFHYHYMIRKYGNNLKLCYMDTDSFVYDIQTDRGFLC